MFNKKPGPVARRQASNDTIPSGRMSSARASANWKDSVSRAQTHSRSQMIRERLYNPPSYTDSLAVYNRNLGGAAAWTPIADAAEKKYGKMDVSKFRPSVYKKVDVKGARKKYGLD